MRIMAADNMPTMMGHMMLSASEPANPANLLCKNRVNYYKNDILKV